MYLPGTPRELIGDLLSAKGITQVKLSEILGITESKISRIMTGDTSSIKCSDIIKFAQYFGVSTDYILGLSTIRTQKNHDISELGLSEQFVMRLLKGKFDIKTLNRLLEHKGFPALIYLIKIYFEDTNVVGVKTYNEILDMGIMDLLDYKPDSQEHIDFLTAHKAGDHESDIEKIKKVLFKILSDIKKDMKNDTPVSDPVAMEFIQKIQAELKDIPQESRTVEDVTNATADMLNKSGFLDDKLKDNFSDLALQMIKQFAPPEEE